MKKILLAMLCFYPFTSHAATEGVLENAECVSVKGWAWNSVQPNAHIKVAIYNGTTKVATVAAKQFRQDLLDAGKGNGEHGFVYNFGAELKNGAKHKITVKFNGTATQLTGSPRTTAVCVGALNDTGWQTCANIYDGNNYLTCPAAEFEGQDGDYGRDAKARNGILKKKGGGISGFDFTKIANSGAKLPATASLGTGLHDWACTLDNVTGLLWEVKTDDNGLRDQDHTYSWYNPDPSTNGGHAGYQNRGTCGGGISCDTQGYVQAVNAQGLCGKKDWRIPKREELLSLVSYDRFNPAIDSGYFPNTPTAYSGVGDYWTAATYAYSDSTAWRVDFYDGSPNNFSKSSENSIRLVRGGQ